MFCHVLMWNCDVLNPYMCEDGVLVLPESMEEGVLLISIAIEYAFNLYNDYAFRWGCSVHKDKQKFKAESIMKYLKQFYYYKQGKKCDKEKGGRSYTKVDIHIDCKAMIEFCLNEEDGWTVNRHNVSHNHGLCAANQRHFTHSQRGVIKSDAIYLQELKDNGVFIATGLRVLKKQVRGLPFIDFTSTDAYNILRSNNLDGGDANALIQIFKWRKENEDDFYFDFEVDFNSSLCCFFRRDGRMRYNYDIFGDLLVHDTKWVLAKRKKSRLYGPVEMNVSDSNCFNILMEYILLGHTNYLKTSLWNSRSIAKGFWYPIMASMCMSSGVGDKEKVKKKDISISSVWRREMLRKFSDLISASELNVNARNT
ncbi:hypothetical protein M9H77_03944 [Catharanthus roseus]|uniref:Uncharacterized protein n=1 Tax=Catharanthus roseus TaxID=4058 RepID=A0ACC0CCQ3_CATRO|nr:hypothetical protein M9H77_03944 [Catharanthus roseus]